MRPCTRSPSSSRARAPSRPRPSSVAQLGEELGEVAVGRRRGRRRAGAARHAELVVVVEVVGRRDQRDDAREALLPDPDDLLLAAHLAVVGAVAAGPLAHRQPVGDHPGEVAGLDPLGPLALHRGHRRVSCSLSRSSPWLADRCGGDGPWPGRRGPGPSPHPATSPTSPWRPNPRADRPIGRPLGTGRRLAASSTPEEPLAGRADHHREAGGDQLVEVGQQGEVVLDGLAEADAGVDPDLLDPGGDGRLGPVDEEGRAPRRRRRRSGGRPASSGGRPACASPRSRRRAGGGRDRASDGRHVVDQRGAGGDGGLGHRGVAGVDAHPHVRRPAPRSTGTTRRRSSASADRLGARAGSTRRRRRRRRRPRRPAARPWATAASWSSAAPAVGERVGGDVEHPHHQRRAQLGSPPLEEPHGLLAGGGVAAEQPAHRRGDRASRPAC